MKLIAGLGNPGEQYTGTRHNAGYMVVEQLAGRKSWSKSKSGFLEYAWLNHEGQAVEVIKPLTFMNKSGEAVQYVLKKHTELSPSDLYVVHDDLDIPLGHFKIQFGRGPRAHGGVDSIEQVLKTDQFWRVRVGVDNRQGDRSLPGRAYVLQKFKRAEAPLIADVVEEIVTVLIGQLSQEENR